MTDSEPNDYWFTSDLFQIEPGEDEETNPLMYGRQLSAWVRQKFSDIGYEPEAVIPEDFGWLVLCARDPFSIGVTCVSFRDYSTAQPDDPLPPHDEVIWCCGVFVEVPFFRRLFKKIDTSEAVEKFNAELRSILESEPRISFVDAP